MKSNMSFQERAQLGLEELSNQSPVTLDMAKEQAKQLKIKSSSKNKKKRDWLISFEKTIVSEGAEQRVYLKDNLHVIKLNDCKQVGVELQVADWMLQVALWLNFQPLTFNLQLNGCKWHLLSLPARAFLSHVKSFMSANGFRNNRNNDYIHDDLGIIIEDLHDENVLTKNEVLYFIDTVFYTTNQFWSNLK